MVDDGEDEELEQPSHADWMRLRRLRIPVAGLVLVAAVGALIMHLTHSPSAPSAVAPSATSTPSVAVSRPSRTPATPAIRATQCPPGVSCFSTTTLPTDVRHAVQAAFPGVIVRSSFSLLGDTDGAGSHLLFRRVNLRSAETTIMVVVERSDVAVPPATATVSARGQSQTIYIATDRFPELNVTVTATSADKSVVTRVRRLAADQRLRAATV